MDIKINLPEEVMYNLFCNANYAGLTPLYVDHGQWSKVDEYLEANTKAFDLLENGFGKNDTQESRILAYLKADPKHKFVFLCEYDDDQHPLTWQGMLKGMQLMASNQTRHFSDVIEHNDDAVTADVWLQLALFGDVIYC
jgi:hypothetical protein